MAEYKLSYTGSEINEKLGKIDNTVCFTEQTLTEEQKAQARANIGCSIIEPEEDDIPKVFFGKPLPQTKNEIIMSFRYISKTMDVSGYCKTKAQGNSSMSYPKKNQTVKLYKDAECTEKLKIDFGTWGKQSKFCFKANWIDITHARNIVSARLWGDVVKSRTNYAELPEPLRTSPNQGAVNGFPVKLYANGIYQGRYTINIPKDAWMANMDDDLDTHCILCGENYVSGCFRAAANIDGADWTDEIHDTVPNAIKTRWNEVISFVMNSTDEEFAANLGNYFDIPSLVDYYLFGVASCGLDAFGKNQLYMTYDGRKWFATMYDMDSTWGLWWTGASFVSPDYARDEFQDFKDGSGNLLYIRLANLFKDEIKTRWVELREGVLSVSSIINRFERFTDICPPWLVTEDYATTTANGAFTAIPSQTTNNIQQIREYVKRRLLYVDDEILVEKGLYPFVNGTKTFNTGTVLTISKGNRVRITTGEGHTLNNFINITNIRQNGDATNVIENVPTTPTLFTIPAGATVEFKKYNTVMHDGAESTVTGSVFIKPDASFGDLYNGVLASDGERTFVTSAECNVGSIGVYEAQNTQFDIEFTISLVVDGIRYI